VAAPGVVPRVTVTAGAAVRASVAGLALSAFTLSARVVSASPPVGVVPSLPVSFEVATEVSPAGAPTAVAADPVRTAGNSVRGVGAAADGTSAARVSGVRISGARVSAVRDPGDGAPALGGGTGGAGGVEYAGGAA